LRLHTKELVAKSASNEAMIEKIISQIMFSNVTTKKLNIAGLRHLRDVGSLLNLVERGRLDDRHELISQIEELVIKIEALATEGEENQKNIDELNVQITVCEQEAKKSVLSSKSQSERVALRSQLRKTKRLMGNMGLLEEERSKLVLLNKKLGEKMVFLYEQLLLLKLVENSSDTERLTKLRETQQKYDALTTVLQAHVVLWTKLENLQDQRYGLAMNRDLRQIRKELVSQSIENTKITRKCYAEINAEPKEAKRKNNKGMYWLTVELEKQRLMRYMLSEHSQRANLILPKDIREKFEKLAEGSSSESEAESPLEEVRERENENYELLAQKRDYSDLPKSWEMLKIDELKYKLKKLELKIGVLKEEKTFLVSLNISLKRKLETRYSKVKSSSYSDSDTLLSLSSLEDTVYTHIRDNEIDMDRMYSEAAEQKIKRKIENQLKRREDELKDDPPKLSDGGSSEKMLQNENQVNALFRGENIMSKLGPK